MRVAQPPGDKGSLKWLQVSVERRPDLLQPSTLGSRIDWLSPLRCDNWAEYRDASFLACLGLSHLADDLAEFWPRRGPQWDALGRSGDKVILVEAKSHLREFLTPATQATNASRSKIERAFRTVHQLEGIEPPSDWTRCFFQLANRIAHLSFFASARHRCASNQRRFCRRCGDARARYTRGMERRGDDRFVRPRIG